jgi:hypothetical protein
MVMNVLSHKVLEVGQKLEAARRAPPLDAKGCSLNWDEANRKYIDWLTLHGTLLIEQSINALKE